MFHNLNLPKVQPISERLILAHHYLVYPWSGADSASKATGEISVIFGGQVSWRLRCYERDEVYFATLLWQNKRRQNGLYIANAIFQIVQNHG